ncbi:unnamed protein product [Ambrosiozyma monospora]|uniref:Unnamed protein product n=1 Tax=Ambrosiozyma monospora TaxID=43982 RepID=A0A9W6Z594_AMBMO|nr:unnamed protein product [Ambrosiozyma monospora]
MQQVVILDRWTPMKQFQKTMLNEYLKYTEATPFTTKTPCLSLGKIYKEKGRKITARLNRLRINFGSNSELQNLLNKPEITLTCGKETITREHILFKCDNVMGQELNNDEIKGLLFEEKGLFLMMELIEEKEWKF